MHLADEVRPRVREQFLRPLQDLDSAPSTSILIVSGMMCSRAKSSSVVQGTLTIGRECSVLVPMWAFSCLSQSRLALMRHSD